MTAFVVRELRQRVFFGLFGSEARDEGEDDSTIDDAAAVEGRLRGVVTHLLVEVQLRGIQDEIRPEHVLVGARPPARMGGPLADLEILVIVGVARELHHFSRSRLAMTSYWISEVP